MVQHNPYEYFPGGYGTSHPQVPVSTQAQAPIARTNAYTTQDWYRQGNIPPAAQSGETRQIPPENGIHQPMQSPTFMTGYSYATGSGYQGGYSGVVDSSYCTPQVAANFNDQCGHTGWYPR